MTPVGLAPEQGNAKAVGFPLSPSTGAWRSFDSSKRFEWLGWDRAIFGHVLERQLDKEWKCSFLPATTPTATNCQLTRVTKPGRGGIQLVLEADREVTKDSSIKVTTVDGTHLVTVPVSECTFTVNERTQSGVAALHVGAAMERLELESPSPSCFRQIEAFPTLRLVSGALEPVPATTEICYESAQQPGKCQPTPGDKQDVRKVYLRVVGVPDNFPLGLQDLELRTATSILGSLKVPVRARAINVPEDAGHHPALSVAYEVSELDASHSGKAIDGFAVVTPHEADEVVAVMNAVDAEITDPSLEDLQRRLNSAPLDLPACQALWTRHRAGWLDAQGALLDETDADAFCVVAEPGAKLPVAAAEMPKLEACRPLAIEEKVEICSERLSSGTIILSRDQERDLEAHRNKRPWRLSAVSWRPHVWFDEDWLRRGESRHSTLSLLRFAVYQSQVGAFEADAELRDASGNVLFRQRLRLADGARAESLPLPLASALRIECGNAVSARQAPPRHRFTATPPAPVPTGGTLPRPANSGNLEEEARTRRVVRDLILNGGVRAVFDEDLDSGGCELVYSPRDMTRFLHRRDPVRARSGDPWADVVPGGPPKDDSPEPVSQQAPRAVDACETQFGKSGKAPNRDLYVECVAAIDDVDPHLHLYGAQLVEVKMKRGTEAEVVDVLSIHPGKESRLRLKSIKQRGGDYTLVARLKGPQLPSVVYRPGPLQTTVTAGSATALPTDLEFQALLRPRGLNGILRNWRLFITFPIRFSGLRFPARSSTLASSGDLTAVQLAGVRAGAMGVIEPWNYDTRQNRGTIVPWRFMTGFNLYDLGTGQFDPAYLTGFSVTLPVLELDGSPTARNLSSAIAVGAFWEVDLSRHHPLEDGNHFLLTFGLDFASLLAE